MRRGPLCALVALTAAVSVSASTGHAQSTNALATGNGSGFDTHLFRPAFDSKGFFTVNGSDILGRNDLMFGLVLDYGNTIMRVQNFGQSRNDLINHSFQGTLQFNYGIASILEVGLQVPLNLLAGEAQSDAAGGPTVLPPTVGPQQWTAGQLDSQTVGFLSAHTKVRLLRVEKGFGLAIGAQIGVPVSDAKLNGGADPSFWYWPQLIGEKRFAGQKFRVGLNAGFRGHGASSTQINLRDGVFNDGQRITYGLGASYRILDAVDLVGETYGTYLLADGATSKIKASNEAVGGLKIFVERNSYLMIGAGGRYTDGFEAANIRGFLGFVFEPSIGDRDGDGIKDDLDKCPDDPEDFDGFQDEDGCPDPDNDNDGILDKNDRCPNEPEDFDGVEDADGCPEGNDGDRDGDGILDSRDKCPDEPEDRDGFEDADGCPDPDNDKDGIPDKKDQCPNEPEDFDGFEDTDGCPDPDNDKDGIPDVRDKCPNEPETFNNFQDEDGCPDKGLVQIDKDIIVILKKILFATNSAEILQESTPILDAVAEALQQNPQITLVEVAGHADERADDNYNLRLTQDRVNSVVTALVRRGVEKKRLRSKGYGEYCPLDPGHNESAWDQNRRVEFKIVKTKEGPTGVELGCAEAAKKGVKPDPVPQ